MPVRRGGEWRKSDGRSHSDVEGDYELGAAAGRRIMS